MFNKCAESPVAAGLLVGGILSGALLLLSPFVLLAAWFLVGAESYPDLALWLVKLYALALPLPLLTCWLIGLFLKWLIPNRQTGSVEQPI